MMFKASDMRRLSPSWCLPEEGLSTADSFVFG
jgi:hypothetical protein